MAGLLWEEEVDSGDLVDTELVYTRGQVLVIVNGDKQFSDVAPWGYIDYFSADTPINGERILFASERLNLKATVWRNDFDWVPEGRVYIYVLQPYPFTQATVQIWDLFA